jgi:hypothetical protein
LHHNRLSSWLTPRCAKSEENGEVHVWYQVTDLHDGLSGGHLYWLCDFCEEDPVEQSELDLTDPRNTEDYVMLE